jgi:branched-chain amino acid transport system permease protein
VTLRSVVLLVACLGAGLVLTGSVSPYDRYIGVTLLTYVVVAQAYNVLAGYSGQLSLGVGAFVGVGAYTAGLLMVHVEMSWLPATVLATLLCALFALGLGCALLRLRGVYFAVGTLAAAVALGVAAELWTWAGGGTGFVIVNTPDSTTLMYAAVVAAVLSTGLAVFVRDSAFGLRVAATRDDDGAAAGVGIAVFWHRLAVFVISGAFMGLTGAIVGIQSISVDPGAMFSINWTIYAALFVIVGGRSTVFGPIAGVLIVYYGLTHELQNLQAVSTIVEGVLLIAVIRFAPEGVWPMALSLLQRAGGTQLQYRSSRYPGGGET